MVSRCIVVGLDGANPAFVRYMIGKGELPNIQRIMREGVFAPYCLSSLPTSTPENWTTIATGAWNGTHKVMSFQVFQPPELHGRWMAGYTSKECQAEFIWDALERVGKRTILIKYPGSHPPTMRNGIQVCGCHVRPCAHQIDGAHMFSTIPPRNAPLELVEKRDQDGRTQLVGELRFEARGIGGESVGAGLDEGTTLYGVPDSGRPKPGSVSLSTPVCKLLPPGKTFYVRVLGSGGEYERVQIARDPSFGELLADMGQGEWSEWLLEPFRTIDGMREGSFRFRLEELSPDGKVVKIYATQIMDVDHYAYPEQVSRELYENVGPFITDIGWEGLGHDRSKAWFSETVMLDLAEYQHQWFSKAIEYLTRTREWTLLMMQAHCIDCANHHCLDVADPATNPDDRSLGDRYLGFIEALYASLDRMLGRIMEVMDDDTVLFVVSDHGGLPGHLRVDTSKVLEEAGLLARNADGSICWPKTRAYVNNAVFVNVNVRGREPEGVVDPSDYESTVDEVVATLHAYVDPRTGLHPYNLVLRKKDMRYVGLYGDPMSKKIGDVLFTVKEPFGGTHGLQLSTASFGLSSNTSLLLMMGPGIRRGEVLERTVWLTDIVPTICHLLGTPVPRDTEGAIIYQALDDQIGSGKPDR